MRLQNYRNPQKVFFILCFCFGTAALANAFNATLYHAKNKKLAVTGIILDTTSTIYLCVGS
jgi:hypothetical protein